MAKGTRTSSSIADLIGECSFRAVGWTAVVLNALAGRRSGDALGILTYHRIAPRVPGLPRPLHNVTPDRFRRQLEGLAARGFRVWPLGRVLRYHEQARRVPPRTVVITFDDGYRSVYLYAWPILRALGMPATVFLSTAFLDGEEPFPFDAWGMAYRRRAPAEAFLPLTALQCRRMLEDGLIELGAHTHTHQDFRNRPEAFRKDLEMSIAVLRSRFGIERPAFAFPFGSPRKGYASEQLIAAARQTAVVCGLTTECVPVDPASDPFGWGRFNAFSWDTATTLAAKLDGWYSWAPKLRAAWTRRISGSERGRLRNLRTACHADRGGV